MWRHYRFDPDFLCRRILILFQSNSVQNLSRLTLKRGEENNPWCYTSQKSLLFLGLNQNSLNKEQTGFLQRTI